MKRIEQLNKNDIEYHLRSAIESQVPNVLDRIDLTVPQEQPSSGRVISLGQWRRRAANLAAACLCAVVLAGGWNVYQVRRVDSVIGIDVNPSIELSVNSRNRVVKAESLNEDAEMILDDMELKNVDLNVALNAVIGSMVQKGFLDDVDNAILVTVANDDAEKASDIRQMVVGDIESSLKENQVEAIVYNQRAVATDEVSELAKEYGISYGKAYFLQELIAQNEDLSDSDMEAFAAMTMEEIAREIADASYDLGADVNQSVDVTLAQKETTRAPETTIPETETESETETQVQTETERPTAAVPTTVPETSTEAEETQSSEELNIKIDYVDFEGGILDVIFKSKVKWRNATISVYDENGESYSAHIIDTGSTSCSVKVSGLPGDEECTFVIGGVALKSGNRFGTVKGYFDTPDIADEAEPTEPSDTAASSEETEEETGVTESSEETEAPTESESISTETSEEIPVSEAETEAQMDTNQPEEQT